jgi:probable HAF family extracellular repeat protein
VRFCQPGPTSGSYINTLDIHGYRIGFVYSNGTESDIDVPCSLALPNNAQICTAVVDNTPSGINDSGQISGTVDFSRNFLGEGVYAYIESNGSWTNLGPGAGSAINASGNVTGTLTTSVGTSAFLFKDGTTTNLGTLGGMRSTGYAINATGQTVGSSDVVGSTPAHAFFYNGVMTDLNAIVSLADPLQPFVTLTSALGINDSRLILTNGVDSRTNLLHAYLLQAPFIELQPISLSFGTEAIGGTTQPRSVVVTNAGITAIPLGMISANSNFSMQANSCGRHSPRARNARLRLPSLQRSLAR